jgi:hypothetical protein
MNIIYCTLLFAILKSFLQTSVLLLNLGVRDYLRFLKFNLNYGQLKYLDGININQI